MSLMEGTDHGEGYADVGAGCECSVLPPQFCCEPKTVLQKESLLKKKKRKTW